MKMTDKVKASLDQVLAAFESGKVAEAIAVSVLKADKSPCDNWSLLNKIFVFMGGSADCRGIRQWNAVERHVKKGSKAVYILVPYIKAVEEENDKGETVKELRLIGFSSAPVFRYEDTEGKPLPELEKLKQIPLPHLASVAERYGLQIQYQPCRSDYYGCYNRNGKITLCTEDERVFYHELAHALHHRVDAQYLERTTDYKEIVADLTACVVAKVYGKDYTGNSYAYIRQYTKAQNPHTACLRVISQVEAVLTELFGKVAEIEAENGKAVA